MEPTPGSRWYHGIWFVLIMLFLVLGPFGLPLLWRSPRFNRPAKITLTVILAVYTYCLFAVTAKAVQLALSQLESLQL